MKSVSQKNAGLTQMPRAARIVDSDFHDPEGLFYLARHLAHLGEGQAALDLLERVLASG